MIEVLLAGDFPEQCDVLRQRRRNRVPSSRDHEDRRLDPGRDLQQGVIIAKCTPRGQDEAVIPVRHRRLMDVAVHGDVPDLRAGNPEPFGHALHFSRAVRQHADGPARDKPVERGLQFPEGIRGMLFVDEHLAHDLPGGSEQERAEQSIRERLAGAHGDHDIVARLQAQQPKGLQPGGVGRPVRLVPLHVVDRTRVPRPHGALPEDHVG